MFVSAAIAVVVACQASASQNWPSIPPNRKGESAWIALRHQHQELNLCVPTSASIILDYFGDSISPREIKALAMNKPYTPGDNFTDFSITFFHDLVAGLARRGYVWREKTYSNDRRGLQKGLREIERSLDAGIPLMIDTTLRPDIGHTFVISGYSIPDQTLFALDPEASDPGIRVVNFRELDRIWTSRGVGSDRRGVVFPQRRRER